MPQVLDGHIGLGDIRLLAAENDDGLNAAGKKGNQKMRKAAEAVTFYQVMTEWGITRGVASCNLWSMRDQLRNVVLSVPTKCVQKF